MLTRMALIAAIAVLVGLAFRHPAARPVITAASALPAQEEKPVNSWPAMARGTRPRSQTPETVVYVAGAVKRPGLYHLRPDDRAAHAVDVAGGFTGAADPAGVNLAAHVADGDEIYVPITGEVRHGGTARHHRSRRPRTPPPEGSVDVNTADATELAAVPGIGRSIAARVVALREQQGAFASLDELLDVAGMTQTRLERARPYLQVTGVAQPTP